MWLIDGRRSTFHGQNPSPQRKKGLLLRQTLTKSALEDERGIPAIGRQKKGKGNGLRICWVIFNLEHLTFFQAESFRVGLAAGRIVGGIRMGVS